MRKGFVKTTMTLVLGIVILGSGRLGLGSTASAQTGRQTASESPAARTATGPVRVLLTGDSLSQEAGTHFADAITATGNAVVDKTLVFGGTAICDWLPRLDAKLAQFRPDVAVAEFSGNALSPCMINPATGSPFAGDAYVDKYWNDANAAMRIFTQYDVTVYWVEAPVGRASRGRPLAPVYGALPSSWENARFVNSGTAVLDRGDYVDYLPCIASEPCTDTDPASGQPASKVRAPDGAHFCPTGAEAVRGVTGGCSVWSSGAWRFGTAMAAPVIQDFGLATAAAPQA